MDTKLQWQPHLDDIQRKVAKTIGAFGALGNSRWGLDMLDMRKIYQGVADADNVGLLGVVQRVGHRSSIHGTNPPNVMKRAGSRGKSDQWCIQSHLDGSAGRGNISAPRAKTN